MVDYHPISLCNILYKLISKILANRLRILLLVLILESQSIFVSGRQNTDNIIISYEIIHFLSRKNKGKQGFMSIKLNMSTMYDKVKWAYLENTLLVLGFSQWMI